MSTTVRLDNVDHASLKLRRGHGARFGEAVNQVAIVASEFDRAQREYPILFCPHARQAHCRAWPFSASTATRTCSSPATDGTPPMFRRCLGEARSSSAVRTGEAAVHVDLAHSRVAAEG
jgi:hypothetical protein